MGYFRAFVALLKSISYIKKISACNNHTTIFIGTDEEALCWQRGLHFASTIESVAKEFESENGGVRRSAGVPDGERGVPAAGLHILPHPLHLGHSQGG